MRARKPANIENDLKTYGKPIVANPELLRGRWASSFLPDAREVRLDLGCGKGAFIAEAARRNPDVLFVGVDCNETCIARSAQKVVEQNIPNVRLVCEDASNIEQLFGQGELDRIYLNFNSPFPKKKHAEKRLMHLHYLLRYRRLLKENAPIDMRTDNVLYWDFSLTQLEIAGYTITQRSKDLHRDADELEAVLASEYDERTVSRGARVRHLTAIPRPERSCYQQTDRLSLTDYLPEDIERFDEVPYGMEDTVANMRNRLANARARALREK